jgi:hypothetical protein
VAGHFAGIEAKGPGKKPTALQEATLETIETAKGATFVIDNVDGLQPLKEWIDHVVDAT